MIGRIMPESSSKTLLPDCFVKVADPILLRQTTEPAPPNGAVPDIDPLNSSDSVPRGFDLVSTRSRRRHLFPPSAAAGRLQDSDALLHQNSVLADEAAQSDSAPISDTSDNDTRSSAHGTPISHDVSHGPTSASSDIFPTDFSSRCIRAIRHTTRLTEKNNRARVTPYK